MKNKRKSPLTFLVHRRPLKRQQHEDYYYNCFRTQVLLADGVCDASETVTQNQDESEICIVMDGCSVLNKCRVTDVLEKRKETKTENQDERIMESLHVCI